MKQTLLPESEIADRLRLNIEKLMFIHKLNIAEIAALIYERGTPEFDSLSVSIRNMIKGNHRTLPSFYTLYKLWVAFPQIELRFLFDKDSRFEKRETIDLPRSIAYEAPAHYGRIPDWQEEKIALLQKIEKLNDELLACMKRTLS